MLRPHTFISHAIALQNSDLVSTLKLTQNLSLQTNPIFKHAHWFQTVVFHLSLHDPSLIMYTLTMDTPTNFNTIENDHIEP